MTLLNIFWKLRSIITKKKKKGKTPNFPGSHLNLHTQEICPTIKSDPAVSWSPWWKASHTCSKAYMLTSHHKAFCKPFLTQSAYSSVTDFVWPTIAATPIFLLKVLSTCVPKLCILKSCFPMPSLEMDSIKDSSHQENLLGKCLYIHP